MAVIAIGAILRERCKKRRGTTTPDAKVADRRAGAAEMERRMAAYLASGNGGQDHMAPQDTSGQEYRR